ncbi:MAG: family 1 glycosylhydrolase [Vulcanimicrobiaceae bacterium]
MHVPFEIWASPEPTIARISHDTFRDQLAETGHDVRVDDLDRLASLGVSATRYPVLWERCAPNDPREIDLRWATERLERLRELDIEPIVTLLHHGSGPTYTSLIDPAFPALFAAYAGAVAARFPWVRRWTPINEPLTTARFSTLYGVWYPNARDDDAAFGAALTNEVLGMLLAMEAIRAHAPRAELVVTEDLQSFTALDPSVLAYVEHKRRRMYLSIELAMGRVRPGHESYAYLAETCGVPRDKLARIAALASVPDLVAWNYYPNSERTLATRDGVIVNDPRRLSATISPRPLLRDAHERLGLPFGIGEVHVHADDAGRVAWLEARVADLVALHADGLPVRALGVWAAFGMIDWNSLLRQRAGTYEHGVFTFAGRGGIPRDTAVVGLVRSLAAASRSSAAAARVPT